MCKSLLSRFLAGFPTRKASFPFLQRYAVLLPPEARAAALDPDLTDEAAGHLCRQLLQVGRPGCYVA